MQLADRGAWPRPWFDRSLLLALDGVVLAIMVVGGRILPGFTANALGAGVVSRRDAGTLDRAALLAMGAVCVADVLGARGPVAASGMLAAAALHGARMWGWGSLATRREPLLWILHAGWAAVAVGLALRGAGEAGAPIPRSAALHALTVGAIGALTLGMMARVTLGHTGRPLKLPRGMSAAFALVLLAVPLRVLPPIVAPGLYKHGMHGAAGLWARRVRALRRRATGGPSWGRGSTAARAEGRRQLTPVGDRLEGRGVVQLKARRVGGEEAALLPVARDADHRLDARAHEPRQGGAREREGDVRPARVVGVAEALGEVEEERREALRDGARAEHVDARPEHRRLLAERAVERERQGRVVVHREEHRLGADREELDDVALGDGLRGVHLAAQHGDRPHALARPEDAQRGRVARRGAPQHLHQPAEHDHEVRGDLAGLPERLPVLEAPGDGLPREALELLGAHAAEQRAHTEAGLDVFLAHVAPGSLQAPPRGRQ
jgi:hypothetical protein